MPRPIHYTIRIPQPESHYLDVEALFPTVPDELFLPVWTPGSYMVREYSRNIEGLRADGADIRKVRKNRWVVSAHNPADEIRLHYRIYCHELSVRTNWVDDQFALINGAATFLTSPTALACEYQVTLDVPLTGAWCGCGLPSCGSNTFCAPDYDALVDSPILVGNPSVYEFHVERKPHFFINQGEAGLWDGAKAAADLATLVEAHRCLWGTLPYEKYLFINLLIGKGGGLEHRNSTVLTYDRYAMRTHRTYIAWLDLASHEFFHVWNVKRLRPAELGPFDYENEVYTRNLWIAEGFTEYYGPLLLRRSGLSTDEEFLGTKHESGQRGVQASLTWLVDELQRTPGRLQQPVSLASFDAWIRHYRPDENSPNVAISYYIKGALIAWLLDTRIRKTTDDRKSLDDVMRLAYERYSGSRGYTDAQFCTTAEEVSGTDLSAWFDEVVHSTDELDYSEALDWFGLRFKSAQVCTTPYTGFVTRVAEGRLLISHVLRDTPAAEAGLSADDEIVGIDSFRVLPDQWKERLEQYAPGQRITLLLSRNDRLIEETIRLAQEPKRYGQLEIDPDATPEQKKHFRNWLTTRVHGSEKRY